MMAGNAIISIRPKFAEAIASGVKTIELRRKIPTIEPGLRLWLYSTMPVGAVIATAEVTKVDVGTPSEMWDAHKNKIGLNRSDFDSYFANSNKAFALKLDNVKSGTPVDIGKMRIIRPQFHPPQVMTFLTPLEAGAIEKLLFEP